MDRRPQDVQATFCATLIDEWIRRGVVHAVVAPGSRSTPMALAIADRAEIAVHVVHDERSAAYVALGLAVDGPPALLLCTSGTAAANFLPAVVEANLSDVGMLVLTADRPEELRGVGAPQAIDQIDLFGKHARWFRDPGVPDDAERSLWRELAVDAWNHAIDGPVHLNLPFREPLLGRADELPEHRPAAAVGPPSIRSDVIPPDVAVPRGVILVGGRSGVSPADVDALRRLTGWPLIADPISGMRTLDEAIAYADAILRNPVFADAHVPDVIVRIGRPAASKVLAQWSARPGPTVIQVGGPGVIDPDRNVAAVCSMAALLDDFAGGRHVATMSGVDKWRDDWLEADRLVGEALAARLDGLEELTEPGVARLVAEHLPARAGLTVASSMPIRDLEWFGGPAARAHANRGANGIDGVTSTALGRALAGRTEFLLIGDLAFVHDSGALVAINEREVDLRIVVVDNDGGGIFSFLPQAQDLPRERFEALFGTPLDVDVVALAAAHGVTAIDIADRGALVAQLATPGPWVARIESNRHRNVVVHDFLHAAAAAALD